MILVPCIKLKVRCGYIPRYCVVHMLWQSARDVTAWLLLCRNISIIVCFVYLLHGALLMQQWTRLSVLQLEVGDLFTEEFSCSPLARQCPLNFTCIYTSEPTAMLTPGMSNVALTMLTIFQTMTMSSWSYVQYRSMDYAGWCESLLILCTKSFYKKNTASAVLWILD